MTLTSLILNVAVLSSLSLCAVASEANYSLWPRRPAELEQARNLVREQKLDEAVELLRPFVSESGIAGREARQISGSINVRRYLSRRHPGATVHAVRRGENLARIAASAKCPVDVIMLLNGLVVPSDLKAGQQLVVVPMNLRVELRPLQREITVWDGKEFVVAYNSSSVEHLSLGENVETTVQHRDGYVNGAQVSRRSTQFLISDRALVLANGVHIVSSQRGGVPAVLMDARDLNELTLLMGVGGRVSIVCREDAFSPDVAPEK